MKDVLEKHRYVAEGAEEEKKKNELHLNAVVPLQQVHQEQTVSSIKRNGGSFSVSLSKMKGGAFSARHHKYERVAPTLPLPPPPSVTYIYIDIQCVYTYVY